ncbi:MAG: alpha-amylase/4-alpha-glucanotransferase domain-containing protein [Sphaerochaetaceae bacterium]
MTTILALTSQLPPGTPPQLLERALSEAYKPILTYIYKNPRLKFHLHLSKSTYEWFELNHPEMNMLIADLVKKEQLELVTGASQQALLHLYPSKDRSTQIEETTTFLRKRFGKRARTIWFFNQIWNPNFVSTMQMGTVDRLLISPYNRLLDVVVNQEPFRMQDMGKIIEVFPTNDKIDSLLAKIAESTITYADFEKEIKALNEKKEEYLTITINLDYLLQGTALNSSYPSTITLFETIVDNLCSEESESALLSTIPFGEIQERSYLTYGWYGRDSRVVDLNSYNDTFVKYEEINFLYGRILHGINMTRIFRKNKDIKKRVESLLLKASGGGAFVFDSSGGFYRSSYRKHSYRYLNEAYRLLSVTENIPYPQIADIDFDGKNEVLWQGRNLDIAIDSKGGSIAQLNYLPSGYNYQDTFSGYQTEVERLSMHHLIDGTFQRSFSDLFFPSNYKFENFAKSNTDSVYDGSSLIYEIILSEQNKNEIVTKYLYENLPFGLGFLELTKSYALKTNTIVVDFSLTNNSSIRSKGLFGSELNLCVGLKGVEEPHLYTVEKSKNRNLALGKNITNNIKNFRFTDNLNKTILSYASDARFCLLKDNYRVALETVMGIEILYQYTQLLPVWEFSIDPGQTQKWTVGFRIEKRSGTSQSRKG